MRAILVTETGGPEALRPAQVPDPVPGTGELLVQVAAAGVNFIDTYHRSGLYPVPLPFTPGVEGSGTVIAVGPDVDGVAIGDRVAWAMNTGSYAELALVPADGVVQVPGGMDLDITGGSLLQGMTAHYLTASTHPVRSGETVLVHAAAGGMGLLLTQMATARGGRVIGTVSTPEKEHLAQEYGAAAVIRYTEVDDLAGEVRRLTDGEGVAAVYDGVGAATFDASLAALRPRGMLALYGQWVRSPGGSAAAELRGLGVPHPPQPGALHRHPGRTHLAGRRRLRRDPQRVAADQDRWALPARRSPPGTRRPAEPSHHRKAPAAPPLTGCPRRPARLTVSRIGHPIPSS
jgi:NADPH2:quinone reductase